MISLSVNGGGLGEFPSIAENNSITEGDTIVKQRKFIALLLAMVMTFTIAGFSSAAAADETTPATVSVQVSPQTISVDGTAVSAEVYNIDGSNYFKLRDVAMLLSDTDAQFSVTYDESTGVISAVSGTAYTAVGGELDTGDDESATCVASTQTLAVDDFVRDVTAYNLGGNNFYKLRDLGSLLGFDVSYDADANAAVIDTTADVLALDTTEGQLSSFTIDGTTTYYMSYMGVVYCAKPVDIVYQSTNIFIPCDADGNLTSTSDSPVFFHCNTGAYMAASGKSPTGGMDDSLTYALTEGYVVVSGYARGRNVTYTDAAGAPVYYGAGPANLIDVKAQVRYLRHNDDLGLWDSDKIVVDGTSASGAMGALLATSGDAADYDPYLDDIGAADASDAIYAVCNFCPIIDLENVEIAYEWMFGCYYDLSFYQDPACDADRALSEIMAGYYPDYLNGLGLTDPATGDALTLTGDGHEGTYMTYLTDYISASATEYLSKMTDDEIATYLDSDDQQGRKISTWLSYDETTGTATVTNFDDYVTGWYKSNLKMKTVPSFNDIAGRHAGDPFYESFYSENSVYGTTTELNRNFSNYLTQALTEAQAAGYWMDLTPADYTVLDETKPLINMYNPMYWIANKDMGLSTFAQHFYVRVGNKDHDTSQTVATNYATLLMNSGLDVNFKMQWDQQHAGDYELDEMFTWIASVVA